MMMPTIRRTFAPRGSTPVNKVVDPHGRVSVCGAIAISPKRTRVGLHYYVLPDNLNFRGPSVVDFLRHLRSQIPGPITIIWDQIIIHSADVVLAYLQTVPDIKTKSFPPYAPELNPVDKAGFYLKSATVTSQRQLRYRATVPSWSAADLEHDAVADRLPDGQEPELHRPVEVS